MEGLPGLTFRMKSFVLFGFLILIGFCRLDHAEAGGAEWKFLEKDDEGSWFYDSTNIDEVVKSQIATVSVIPAKAGIQLFQDVLDPGFRRGDDWSTFYEIIIQVSA